MYEMNIEIINERFKRINELMNERTNKRMNERCFKKW